MFFLVWLITYYTCVNSPSEDPGPSGDGCFYQTLSEHLLEFGLQVEVLQATVHRDEQGGQLQLPLFHHQMQKIIRFAIIGHTDILAKRKREGVNIKYKESNVQECS